MKKRTILLGIICSLMLFTFTGCGSKTAINTEEFERITKENELTFYNDTSLAETNEYINNASLAYSTNDWQIEFYEMDNEEHAVSLYNSFVEVAEDYEDNSKSKYTTTLIHQAVYSLSTDTHYIYVGRVDNTVVYVREDAEYKDTIKDFIEDMGY